MELVEAVPQGAEFRRNYKFGLRNVGSNAARFVSAYLFFLDYTPTGFNWYDGEGNLAFPMGKLVDARQNAPYGKLFIMSGDMLLYPGQSILFATLIAYSRSAEAPRIKYIVYAENMIPNEGEII